MLLVSAGDDLVFRSGAMHVVSTPGTPWSSSVNPHSCLFTGTQQFTWDVTGGTGQFAGATGSVTGTIGTVARLARNPDGSGSFTQFPRHEVDKFAESGVAVVLKRVSLPEDLRSARVIRLVEGGQESLTAFSRTDRTVPGHGVYSGRPAGR
jgi:hypothetical protein